jgi:diphthamide synthase (EF-2-diphthine--ammonia ligase)
LRSSPDFEPAGLLTTITEDYDRISLHGVRRALLERQAESLGLPLRKVLIPKDCTNANNRCITASARRVSSEGKPSLQPLRLSCLEGARPGGTTVVSFKPHWEEYR